MASHSTTFKRLEQCESTALTSLPQLEEMSKHERKVGLLIYYYYYYLYYYYCSCSWWSQGYMYYVCSIPGDRFECSKLFNGEDQTRPDQTRLWQSVAVCGRLLQYVPVCASLCQSVLVFGSQGQSVAVCGSLWQSV